MKKFILIFTLLVQPALAHDHDKNFDERKAKALEKVDKNIATLNNLKSCISSASKKEDIKECRKSHKISKMERRRERMGERMDRKKKRMDEKLKKMKDR